MKTQPLVSILIPLYNQERYFKACMRSVEAQTYKNLEIIVVNDGSTDRSPQMAKDWAARDSRVKVLDKQNEGVTFARRDAYLAAKGEFVTFLDSDDMLLPRSIGIMVETIQAVNVDLVMGMHDKFVGHFTTNRKACRHSQFPCGKVVSQPELFDIYYENFFCSSRFFPVSMWAKLYRKSVIDKAYQETELFSSDINLMGEDLLFNMKVFPFLNSMYRIEESVYRYRYGGGTTGFNKNMPQILVLSDTRLELLDQYNYTRGYGPLFAEYVAFVYNHAAQLIYFNQADKKGVIEYFKQELASRKLIPRLEDYYAQKNEMASHVRLLLDHNYEDMYDYARSLGTATYGSTKFKIIAYLVKVCSLLS